MNNTEQLEKDIKENLNQLLLKLNDISAFDGSYLGDVKLVLISLLDEEELEDDDFYGF